MQRWPIVLGSLVLFATGADALIFSRGIGTVSTATVVASAIDVYPGCPSNPAAPTDPNSKTWYFDAGAGHSQSYYASNPPPGGHYAGDASYPYDNPNAIANSTLPAGWTSLLAANAVWNHGGTIHSDYGAVGTITVTVTAPMTIAFGATMLDTAGQRFVIGNHTFTAAGSTNLKIMAQTPGVAGDDPSTMTFTEEQGFSGAGAATATFALTANMTGGANYQAADSTHSRIWPGDVIVLAGTTQFPSITYGGAANLTVANVDPTGALDYLWIEGDGVHRPHISGLSIGEAEGIIIKGIDVDNTNPLSVFTASTQLSNGVTFPRVAANGDTFTVNNEVWTYTTGTPGAFQIAAGLTATDTATNTATTLAAATSPGALGWTSYSHSGANVTMRKTGFSSSGPLPSFSTSIIQTNTEAGISVGQPTPSNVPAVKVSGTLVSYAQDIYMDDVYADAAQQPGTHGQLDDYPETGSMGIDQQTGLQVPANVGGPWNSVDWIFQTRTGFELIGGTQNPITNAADPTSGVQCITLENTTAKYGTVGYVVSSSKKVLIKNALADYAGSDNFVNANSNWIDWEGIKVRNTVDNGSGAHPDGWQGQSTINDFHTHLGETWPAAGPGNGWHDITINGMSVYPASDTVLSSLSYADFNGVSRPLAGEPTGIQGTITAYYDSTFTNNLIFSHNCPNLSVGEGYNLTIANNTVLWDGSDPTNPNLFACVVKNGQITVNISNASAGLTMPYNIVLTNNVANVFNRGPIGETCNDGVVFHNDRAVLSYYQGADQDISNQGACASESSGTIAFQSFMTTTSWEDGNLISLPTTPLSSIFTSYAPSGFPANIATQFDVTPAPGSPLIGAGTTCCGATTTDFNGNPRASPPNVGAF